MRRFYLLLLICFSNRIQGQSNILKSKEILQTSKYAGIYSYGKDVEKEPVGSITVYPETDSSVLFFIDVCVGAPSYNLGQLYSRMVIRNGRGIFYSTEFHEKYDCKWQVDFKGNILMIKTIDDNDDCGFGAYVSADSQYIRKGRTKPDYFIDGHGHRIFFNQTSPESYLR